MTFEQSFQSLVRELINMIELEAIDKPDGPGCYVHNGGQWFKVSKQTFERLKEQREEGEKFLEIEQ